MAVWVTWIRTIFLKHYPKSYSHHQIPIKLPPYPTTVFHISSWVSRIDWTLVRRGSYIRTVSLEIGRQLYSPFYQIRRNSSHLHLISFYFISSSICIIFSQTIIQQGENDVISDMALKPYVLCPKNRKDINNKAKF